MSRAAQYSMASRNALTTKKSWATQTQTHTNPNVDNLPEIQIPFNNGELGTVSLQCNNPAIGCSLSSDCNVPGPVIPICINNQIPLYNYKMQITYSSVGTNRRVPVFPPTFTAAAVTATTTTATTAFTPLLVLDGNGVTVKYTGPSSLLTNPTFVQANPRGSGSGLEWFAIVDNTAPTKTMINYYARNDASAIASFKPPGRSLSMPVVPFNNIVTTLMTDMSSLFFNASAFNQPVGSWDTSNITDMEYMFSGATIFNQSIDLWNTSSITNMRWMFGDARAFNQPVGSWNTAKVTNTNGTFYKAYAFNQDNSAWNTSNVTNMDNMFANATSFNKAIGAWNTSKVTTMANMFNGAAAFNQNIIGWNVSNVVTQPPTNFVTSATVFDSTKQPIWITLDGNGTTIKYSGGLISANPTFVQAKPRGSGSGLEWFAIVINDAVAKTMITNYAKNDDSPAATAAIASLKPPGQSSPVPFNNIITSLMTDMSSLFSSVSAFNEPIGAWDTSKVTTMASLFSGASAFNQPIGSWNTSNVTTMVSMFNGASAFNQYITNWNVNNVILFNTFKQNSNLTDPNTPTNFLNPPTLSFPIGRIPITPIFYDNVVNKVVTITRPVSTSPVSTSSGGFTYSASVKTVKLDATNYSNTISGVTVSTDGNQDCILTIPKNNTSFINRIGLIATQSSTSYYKQGSVEYPIDIDVINTASDQVFLHSTKFNGITTPTNSDNIYVWMSCLGEVQSVSSILGFSFQCFGGIVTAAASQTFEIIISVSNPTSAWENAVSTVAETTISFSMSSVSGMDGRMTFIPFSPSLLANTPSYVENIRYSPPGGLNSAITSYLGTLQPGCYLKMSLQIIQPKGGYGTLGTIQLSNNDAYFYYITGSLVIYNQNANNAGELSSPQTTPNPNDLTYTASRIVFSDTVSNMLSRMGNSWNSLMFTYVRINPIEFTNNNQGYPQYPMDLKLELTIWGLDTTNYGYKLYYMTVEFQVQASYVFSNPLNIHFNMPAPGTKGSIDMKDTYGYYIKTCRGFGNGITIVWGINGIGSITRNTTNLNMLTTSSSYPFVNKQIRVSFIGGNTQPDNTTILNGKVDITLSTTNTQNQFRPQNVGWEYSRVALKGW